MPSPIGRSWEIGSGARSNACRRRASARGPFEELLEGRLVAVQRQMLRGDRADPLHEIDHLLRHRIALPCSPRHCVMKPWRIHQVMAGGEAGNPAGDRSAPRHEAGRCCLPHEGPGAVDAPDRQPRTEITRRRFCSTMRPLSSNTFTSAAASTRPRSSITSTGSRKAERHRSLLLRAPSA